MYYKLGQACVTNWGSYVYYKLGQTLLQIKPASLLQIGTSVIRDWGSYYKIRQPLLQNRAAITNLGKIYCKLCYKLLQISYNKLLQIRAVTHFFKQPGC